MTCTRCRQPIDQIRRYGVEVEWFSTWGGAWSQTMREHPGSHFHLYCTNGHLTKAWADELDEEVLAVVLTGHTVFPPEDARSTQTETDIKERT